MKKRLRFFDKDTIPWGGYPLASFYVNLTQLKKKNKLIAAGEEGGAYVKIKTSNDKAVYAFLRKKTHRQMFVILNLSPVAQEVLLTGTDFAGQYQEAFTAKNKEFKAGEKMKLAPWEYFVYETE